MEKKNIRLLSCVLSALMVATAFGGCSSAAPATSSGAAPASESAAASASDAKPAEAADSAAEAPAEAAPSGDLVELEFLLDKNAVLDGYKAVTDKMETELNIKTNYDIRPAGAEGENLLRTRLATNEVADLILFNSGSLLPTLNPEQNFVDISDRPYVAQYDEQFKSAVSVNGKVFGIPVSSAGAGGWMYNKKIYEELGLEVPKTWSQLMDNCQKVKDAGKTAVIGSYKDDWSAQLILLSDYYNTNAAVPTFADDFTANKAKFATTPSALRSFEKLQEPFTKGFMNKDFLATTYDQGVKMLVDGEGAHYPALSGGFTTINSKYPDKLNDIGMFGQPGDSEADSGLTVWYPGGIYFWKNSEKQDAMAQWAEYYMKEDSIHLYSSIATPEGPYVIKGMTLPDNTPQGVKDLVPYFDNNKTYPALEFVSAVKGPNSPQLCIECGSGLATPLEVAEKYDKDVEKQAKQLALEGW